MPSLRDLTTDECWARLRAEYTALVSFAHEGDLHAMPVNISVRDRSVWFRTEQGTKLAAARAGARMVVAVEWHDDLDHLGWSVAARGPAAVVPDGPPPDDAPVVRPWRQDAQYGEWVRVAVDTITGRQLALGTPPDREQ